MNSSIEIFRITKHAHQQIIEESRKSFGIETGGILIGDLEQKFIFEAGGPGPKAKKAAAHFSPDVKHDQALLDRAKKEYGDSAAFLGYWHRHPGSLDQPSGGDLAQARELLRKFKKGGDHGCVLSIITTLQ